MKLKVRIGIFMFGVGLSFYGLSLMYRGIAVFRNSMYHADMYSAGIVATGIFFSLLALLPPASWVDRWLSRKKTYGGLHRHRHLNR